MGAPRPDLQQWSRELAQHQMPAFARTAQTIARHAGDQESSAAELARQILQDVSMTTRLLRMANSIHFNRGGGKINTVSRAIVLLGFDVVRDLCLTISIIDTFLTGPHRAQVSEEMALSFHAATQARSLAELTRQRDPEEVFIATLLMNLGDLAFLCFAQRIDPDSMTRLSKARAISKLRKDEVEREVLGFPIRDLTALLNREWRLSPLLGNALDPLAEQSERTDTIRFGRELAENLLAGADSPKLADTLARIARRLDLKPDDVRELMWKNARSAAEMMERLGSPGAARLIPQPNVSAQASVAAPANGERSVDSSAAPAEPAVSSGPWHAGDAQLQLGVLRDLSQLLVEARPSVGVLMELVLEGVLRGVGMDRAVFALLTPDRRMVRSKFVLCADGAALPQSFEFATQPADANPIEHVLRSGEPGWVGGPGQESLTRLVDPRLRALCGGQCFLMPLSVSGTSIGVLYADRAGSGRALSDELFTQFKLFGQQARMGLSFIKTR